MGTHCSKVYSSPPANNVIVPASTAGVDPEIATSSKLTPLARASLCRLRDSSGEIVLISRMTDPGSTVEKTPPLSKYTERTAASLAKQERITSDSATRSAIDAATAIPSFLSFSAGGELRFHA